MLNQGQSVAPNRWQRLTVAFLALAFCAVFCAGAAQTLDILLAKQVDETNAESGISDLSLLSALHTPWLAIPISAPRALWLVAPSDDYLPLGHTSSPNYVRPPPLTS